MSARSDAKNYAESNLPEFNAFLAMEASRHFSDTAKPITVVLVLCCGWNLILGGTWAGLAWMLPTIYMQMGSTLATFFTQKGEWSNRRRYLPDVMIFLVLFATFILDWTFSLKGKFSDNAPTIFATLICSVITYHKLKGTIIRNLSFFGLFSLACMVCFPDDTHLKPYIVQAFLGTFTGTCFSHLYTVSIEFKFLNEQTGQRIQRHLIGELAKLAFPHQIESIQKGDKLESTMPVSVSTSTVLVFDVQNSSKILSTEFKQVLDRVISACNEYITATYTKDRECLAYKLNEAYDGFICSIGFPFTLPKSSQHLHRDQVAVELAFRFVEIFDETIRRECPDERVFCAVGIANGEIEGYYPHSGPKFYGMRGSSIILAARYEAYRKALSPNAPINANIVQLQASVWANLSAETRQKFLRSDLPTHSPIRNADGETEIFYYLSDNSEQEKIEQAYRRTIGRGEENGVSAERREKTALQLVDRNKSKKHI